MDLKHQDHLDEETGGSGREKSALNAGSPSLSVCSVGWW